MPDEARSIVWEAPEHHHIEKTSDWYWILGIVALTASVTSIIFNNILFGVVILLAASTMLLMGHRTPRTLEFEVSARGIRVASTLYSFAQIDGYAIQEEDPVGPSLIVRTKHVFAHLLVIPLPPSAIDEIERILETRIPEIPLTEPLSHKLLEFFGF